MAFKRSLANKCASLIKKKKKKKESWIESSYDFFLRTADARYWPWPRGEARERERCNNNKRGNANLMDRATV